MESLAGTTIEEYKLLKSIGNGPTGETLAAVSASGEACAVKVLHQALSLFTRVESYWEEVQLVGELKHAHICTPTSGDWSKSGKFYLVMEQLAGKSLDSVLEEHKTLPISQVLPLMTQVCMALETLHGEGMVHGALKPRNIFLCEQSFAETFSVRVLDFGTTHLLKSGAPEKEDADGVGMADPRYMSPEELIHGKDPTAAADIYALGVVLYQCLVGEAPLAGGYGEVARKMESFKPTFPEGFAEGVAAVIARALSVDPAARFQKVSELREALDSSAAAAAGAGTAPLAVLFPGKESTSAVVDSAPAAPAEETAQVDEPPKDAGALKAEPSSEVKPAAAAEPAPEASTEEKPPEDPELASIAKEAATQLKDNQEKVRVEKAREGTKKTKKARKGPPRPAPGAPVQSFRDGDGDLVELPVERSVKAFVDSLSGAAIPVVTESEGGNGTSETLDAALDQFMEQARTWSAALPPEVVDEEQLAKLAKPPVVVKEVEKIREVVAPAPVQLQESSSGGGGGKVLGYVVAAAVIGAVLTFGFMKFTTPSPDTAMVGTGEPVSPSPPAATEPGGAPEPAAGPQPGGEPHPAGAPGPEVTPLDEAAQPGVAGAGSPPPGDEQPSAGPAEPAAPPAGDTPPAPAGTEGATAAGQPEPAPAAEPAPSAEPAPADKVAAKPDKPRKKPVAKKPVAKKPVAKKPAPSPEPAAKPKGKSDWVDPFSQ